MAFLLPERMKFLPESENAAGFYAVYDFDVFTIITVTGHTCQVRKIRHLSLFVVAISGTVCYDKAERRSTWTKLRSAPSSDDSLCDRCDRITKNPEGISAFGIFANCYSFSAFVK